MAQTQSARDIQQIYLENLGDRDWDMFTESDYHTIKFKVAYAIYGPPAIEGDLSNIANDPGYTKKQYDKISPIYEKIKSFGKYSDKKRIYMSILFVCLIPESDKITNIQFCDGMEVEDIRVSPVFKIRKCINAQNTSGGCCIFLDDIGREYQTWNDYLEANKMPKGIIIAPRNGRYFGGLIVEKMEVQLEIVMSPACSFMARARKAGETAGTVVAAGAVGVLGFSFFAPVAAGVAITAGIASAVTGVFGVATSSATLADRHQHGQKISLADAEARMCWLNIGACATGVLAGAGSQLLSNAASKGVVIGNGLKLTHDAAILAALISGSAGFMNSLFTLIMRFNETGETPTTLELFQLASSALFLTNSLMNNRMASTIITESQNGTIVSYRSTLRSGRHRKMFDKMVAETRRTQGVAQGNSEVIQGISRITNKDQFFQGALRLNKDLNEHKVKISIDKSGQALLNGEHAINPDTLSASSSAQRTTILKSVGENQITTRNVSTSLGMETRPNFISQNLVKDAITFAITSAKLIDSFPDFSGSNSDILDAVAIRLSRFSSEAYNYFVQIVNEVYRTISIVLWERLRALEIRDTELFEKLICFILGKLKQLALDEQHIPDILKMFFVNGHISHTKIKELLLGFENVVNAEYRRIGFREVRCKICKGIRFAE